jgi:hypothetical protein
VPRFELVAREETDTFTLVRVRAIGPQRIGSPGLTHHRLGRDLAVTLRQAPER